MNLPAITPRIRSAISLLQEQIKISYEGGILRLPTVKSLAASMKMSTHTLSKALTILNQQGIVTKAPRIGTQISAKGLNSDFERRAKREEAPAGKAVRRSDPLKQRLLNDLVIGKLGRNDKFPTMKELSGIYGSCYSKVKATLDDLVEDRVLSRYKKGYRFLISAPAQGCSRLVVIAQTNSVQSLAKYTPRSNEFWRLLERECAPRGLIIDIWTFEEARRNLAPGRRDGQTDVLGYLIITLYEDAEERYAAIALLERMHRPVVVMDEIGESVIPSTVMTDPLMRLIIMSTTALPGRTIGTHLLSLGHRRAAYFGAFAGLSWSVNRYKGLSQIFSEAGIADGVVQFGCDRFDEWKECVMAEPGSKPFETVLPDFGHIRKIMNPDSRLDTRGMYLASMSYMWEMRLEAIMKPIFEKALADRTISAWVAENDSTALLALEYLRSRSIRVPEEISVVGMDNVIESLGMGLTTYDFDVPALVQATMNHILVSGSSRRLLNRGPLEIHGMLIKRMSTGPARKVA